MNSGRNIGVVVVHGIGDPEPGAALHDLTDSLAAPEIGVVEIRPEEDEVRRLVESDYPSGAKPSPAKPLLELFPMHIRRGTLAPPQHGELVFAEVFWGSASRLPGGWWGVVLGIANLIGGMASAIDGTVPPGEKTPGRFNRLVKFASHLLVGPIAAANLIALLGILLFAAASRFRGLPADNAAGAAWIAGITVLAAVLAGLRLARGGKARRNPAAPAMPRPPSEILGWSLVIAGPLGFLVTLLTTPAAGVLDYSRAALVCLLLLFFVMWVLLLALVCWHSALCLLERRRSSWRSAALLAVCIQYSLWIFLVPTAWGVLIDRLGEPGTPFRPVLEDAAPGEGIQFVLGTFVIAVVLLTMLWRSYSSRRSGTGPSAEPAPRLIVHPAISGSLFALCAVGSLGLILHTGFSVLNPDARAVIDGLLERLDGLQLFNWTAPTLVILLPFSVALLRLALDLANDVLVYIHWNCQPMRRLEQRTRERGEGDPDIETRISLERQIRRRFYIVLKELFRRYDVDRLVVFAHSQGSVIAIDELAHSFTRAEWADRAVTLVTFGSPVSHLYQHYFPATYPPWPHPQWDELFARVKRWINLYRSDDFVGTRVDDPLGPRPRPPDPTDPFFQCAIGLGGHTDYWRDRTFLRQLQRLGVFDEPASAIARWNCPP